MSLTLKVPEKLQLYGLYVYYVVHICDFGMLRGNDLHPFSFQPLYAACLPSFIAKEVRGKFVSSNPYFSISF